MSESSLSDFGDEAIKIRDMVRKARPAVPATAEQPESANDTDELLKVIELTQWAVVGVHTFKPVSVTYPQLHSGVFNIHHSQHHGIVFEKKTICVDDLLKFSDSISEKILNEITTFWNKETTFKKYGFLHRRGYLLHGPAGSGKTCLVQQIIADIVNAGGIVFQCSHSPDMFNAGLALYRKIEPHRPVVCLFEDIDAIIDQCGEDAILNLLDGENQIDKVLNIATTNYPEKLDRRLVARPRRFDRVIKIGMPSADVRRMYFNKKLKITAGKELDKWTNATDGFSFAACAELVISVYCFDKKFEDAVNTLREMMDSKVSSSDYYNTGPKGFAGVTRNLCGEPDNAGGG
jgi:AAA+ superfamily predicted ATPase